MTALITLLGGVRATIFAALALLLLAACGVQSYRLNTAQKAVAIVATKAAKLETARAHAETKASEAARAEERSRAEAVNAVANAYEKGKKDAQATADRDADDLRAGTLRFRSLWAGCQARLSDATASTSELDAEARLRADSAGRIVRAVAECQAQRDALQAVIAADRK